MARKKSTADIIAQRNRIQQELLNTNQMNDGRYKRVGEIADRYIKNIEKNIGSTLGSDGRHNEKAHQQVSRTVYMTGNNG